MVSQTARLNMYADFYNQTWLCFYIVNQQAANVLQTKINS